MFDASRPVSLICIAGWIILIPSYLWSYDSKIEAAQDLIRSRLNEDVYANFNGASLFTTCVIFALWYCMLVLLQILAIYLALVSNINTLPKIVVKIPKVFNIFNLDTLPCDFLLINMFLKCHLQSMKLHAF